MKDSQQDLHEYAAGIKYIKESNERFSTVMTWKPRPV